MNANQYIVLRHLRDGQSYPFDGVGASWVIDNHSTTLRTLGSLVERGLVRLSNPVEGQPRFYILTDEGETFVLQPDFDSTVASRLANKRSNNRPGRRVRERPSTTDAQLLVDVGYLLELAIPWLEDAHAPTLLLNEARRIKKAVEA